MITGLFSLVASSTSDTRPSSWVSPHISTPKCSVSESKRLQAGSSIRFASVDVLVFSGSILGIVGLGTIIYVFVVWSDKNYGSLQMTRQMTIATTLIVAAFQNVNSADSSFQCLDAMTNRRGSFWSRTFTQPIAEEFELVAKQIAVGLAERGHHLYLGCE